jgi:hypothetical protein
MMKTSRLLAILAIVLLMATLATCVQAGPNTGRCLDVAYTGQFFDPIIPTNFCAKVTEFGCPVMGAPFYFKGQEVCTGQCYTAGFGFGWSTRKPKALGCTDGMGVGCAYETWPPGVFEVEAVATMPNDSLPTPQGKKKEFESFPAAVTILSPSWSGIFAGGKVSLDTFINKWGTEENNCWRDATVGFAYQTDFSCVDLGPCLGDIRRVLLDRANRSELLFLDPKCCTEIESCDFNVWLMAPCPDDTASDINQALVRGYCNFEQNGCEFIAQFEMTLTPKSQGQAFTIKVFRIPTCILYKASGTIKCGDSQFRLTECDGGG